MHDFKEKVRQPSDEAGRRPASVSLLGPCPLPGSDLSSSPGVFPWLLPLASASSDDTPVPSSGLPFHSLLSKCNEHENVPRRYFFQSGPNTDLPTPAFLSFQNRKRVLQEVEGEGQ